MKRINLQAKIGEFNMEKDCVKEYTKEYEKLGILTKLILDNYDPDTYGKMLLSNLNSMDNIPTYSTETELIVGINEII